MHVVTVLDLIYTGSLGILLRAALSVYIASLAFIICLVFITWWNINGLFNFFRPLTVEPAEDPEELD